MSEYRIPLNRPAVVGSEFEYIRQALDAGHISGDGAFTRRCSELLQELIGAERVMLTTSCTHALELRALLLELQPGDEVIVPSFAFVTTASAFALHGARPVFADIRPDTLNLDESRLESLVTPRTRAIVALHYAGVGCELDAILRLTEDTPIEVVEDNAHGLLGTYRGRPLGSFGCVATQSFHETKNLTCGEGGALVINRPSLIERAETLREKGTDRARFFRGQVDKYTWVDLGSSYLPSEILAAFLLAQLEAREQVQARRSELWNRYRVELADWAQERGIGLPQVPDHCVHPSRLFYLVLPDEAARRSLIDRLRARGILAVFHYQPLHLSAVGRKLGGRPGDCPVAERMGDCLLRLPLYHSLGDAEQAEILDAVLGFDPC